MALALKNEHFVRGAIFFLVVVTVSALIFLRVYKIRRERRKKSFQHNIDTFLNNCLFDDMFDFKKEAQVFKTQHLASVLQRKIAIKQVLVYNENLKGESSLVLRSIFHELELDKFVLNSLKKGRWFDKAKAIYVLSELHIRESKAVACYLNDKHESVRAQAIYFLSRQPRTIRSSFYQVEKELTLWELIQIENSLKFVYKGPTSDFSIWLNHKLSTVLIFSIRMIQQFNQFEHIPAIVPFLIHPNEYVRKEAVSSLRKLNYDKLLDEVVPRYSHESRLVKKEIIKAVESLGDLSILHKLKPVLAKKEEWQTNLMYLRAEKRMQLHQP